MADLQVTVGGTTLDNGSTIRIFGQPVNDRSVVSGVQLIQVTFHIQAATADALQTLWGTVKSNFNTQDATVVLTYDSAAGSTMETFTKGDDDVLGMRTSVRQSSSDPSTKFSMECILDIIVNLIPETPTSGQVGDIIVSQIYSAGRLQGRVLTAAYKDANGADALANYNTARATLLTSYLAVDSDGGRDGTTGLALTGETINKSYTTTDSATNERRVSVVLTAEEIPNDFSAETALRSSDVSISVTKAPRWLSQDPVSGGARPSVIIARGTLAIDKGAMTGTQYDTWARIESQVESLVTAQVHKAVELFDIQLAMQVQASVVNFVATYLGDNVTVFDYFRSDAESESSQFRIHADSDGYEVVQKRPGKNPLIRTISVSRTGVGQANITPAFGGIDFNLSRTETGYYILIDKVEESSGPFETEIGSNVYEQRGIYSFRRVNFKFGDQVEVMKIGV